MFFRRKRKKHSQKKEEATHNVNNDDNKNIESNAYRDEEFVKKLNDSLNFYQSMFPFHKFILYPQVIDILEKYDLYIGKTNMYKEDVPDKNVNEIQDFFDNYELKIIDNSYHILPSSHKQEPLCAIAADGLYGGGIQMYICAPRKEFVNDKGTVNIGRELFYNQEFDKSGFKTFRENLKAERQKLKDPIVLMPVKTYFKEILGFIVVTKWGIEAEDSQISSGINN